MKAAQLIKYGGEDSLKVNENVPTPLIEDNKVLIKVHAAAVNPFDLTVREGRARQMKELDLPATLGGDVAGVVAEVGHEVSSFQAGQEVYGQADALSGQGSFAEYTLVKTGQLAAKPTKVDWIEAASLPLVGSSAYQALVDHIDLQAGQKILIHGGAGGIGSIAIQLAKHLGAYVITTVSSEDSEYVKKLGADKTVDYKNQDFSQDIQHYDAVYDTIGGETNLKSYGILKPGGHLVSMVEQANEELIKKYQIKYTAQFTKATSERLKKVAELVDAGVIKTQIDKIFLLDNAPEALEHLKTKHSRGKVVLKIR
jgi:NADPH:quinone reductase-like Zn-dependent oxidoreductase